MVQNIHSIDKLNMEKLINDMTESYAEQYFNLTQQALAKIEEIVKARQGRITLFALRDTWDDEASEVKEDVRDNAVALIIDNGSGSTTMYPIDFFDNNGYISVLLVDEYGDHPRIYADKMDDLTICTLADFLLRISGQDIPAKEPDFKIAIEWCVEDVFTQADQDEVEITTQEAKEILQWIDVKHDANIGVNWDVISVYTGMYLAEMKPKAPFERFIYNDHVYFVRTIKGYIVAGFDLRDVLIDKQTGLPNSHHEAFVDNDIAYYADTAEMAMPDDELAKLIDKD